MIADTCVFLLVVVLYVVDTITLSVVLVVNCIEVELSICILVVDVSYGRIRSVSISSCTCVVCSRVRSVSISTCTVL